MNMIAAVGSCFRQYVGFSGRAQRSEFWYWTLFTILAGILLAMLDGFIVGFENADSGPLGSLFSLATLLPGLAVGWRRLHDTGRSGWWIGGFYLSLILLVVILVGVVAVNGSGDYSTGGGIMLIVFFCQDSQYGPNKYGSNPKDEGNVSVFD